VLPMGALILCIAMIAFGSTPEGNFWGSFVAPFYSTFFELILPLLTLTVALIRSWIPAGKEARAP